MPYPSPRVALGILGSSSYFALYRLYTGFTVGALGVLIVYLGPLLAFQAVPLDREYPTLFPPNCAELNFAISLLLPLRPEVWVS